MEEIAGLGASQARSSRSFCSVCRISLNAAHVQPQTHPSPATVCKFFLTEKRALPSTTAEAAARWRLFLWRPRMNQTAPADDGELCNA